MRCLVSEGWKANTGGALAAVAPSDIRELIDQDWCPRQELNLRPTA